MEPIDIGDYIRVVRDHRIPPKLSDHFTLDDLTKLGAADDFDDLRKKLAAAAQTTVSTLITNDQLHHPRRAADTCQTLLRRILSLREEHRTLFGAQSAEQEGIDDLQGQLNFRRRPDATAYFDARDTTAKTVEASVRGLLTNATNLSHAADIAASTTYSETSVNRISCMQQDRTDLSMMTDSAANQPPANGPITVDVMPSYGFTTGMVWGRSSRYAEATTVRGRIRELDYNLSEVSLYKEQYAALEHKAATAAEVVSQTAALAQAQLDKQRTTIERQDYDQDNAQLQDKIRLLTSRQTSFLADFQARVRLTVGRYIDTAHTLDRYSQLLETSAKVFGLGEVAAFDSSKLFGGTDGSGDDTYLAGYADALAAFDLAWDDRAAESIEGCFYYGEVPLLYTMGTPPQLSAEFAWQPAFGNALIDGFLVLSDQREAVELSCEIQVKVRTTNQLGATDTTTSLQMRAAPGRTCLDGDADHSLGFISGDFLVNLIPNRKVRIAIAANGRTQQNVRLFIRASAIPQITPPRSN